MDISVIDLQSHCRLVPVTLHQRVSFAALHQLRICAINDSPKGANGRRGRKVPRGKKWCDMQYVAQSQFLLYLSSPSVCLSSLSSRVELPVLVMLK